MYIMCRETFLLLYLNCQKITTLPSLTLQPSSTILFTRSMSSGNSDRETDKRSSFFITLVKQHAEVEVVETRGSDDESLTDPQEGWKPSKQAYFITASLGLILFVVALDASILVTALPVCIQHPRASYQH